MLALFYVNSKNLLKKFKNTVTIYHSLFVTGLKLNLKMIQLPNGIFLIRKNIQNKTASDFNVLSNLFHCRYTDTIFRWHVDVQCSGKCMHFSVMSSHAFSVQGLKATSTGMQMINDHVKKSIEKDVAGGDTCRIPEMDEATPWPIYMKMNYQLLESDMIKNDNDCCTYRVDDCDASVTIITLYIQHE